MIGSNEAFQAAAKLENKGFEQLLHEDFEGALEAFKTSEARYPSIKKDGKPLSAFVAEHKRVLQSGNKKLKQQFFANLLEHYSEKMTEKVKKQIRDQVEKIIS